MYLKENHTLAILIAFLFNKWLIFVHKTNGPLQTTELDRITLEKIICESKKCKDSYVIKGYKRKL